MKTSHGGLPAVEVVAAVIERDGRILIARRPAASHLGGLWEFPGGKRQDGEDARTALAREIREELGAAVTVGPLLETVDWSYPDKRVRLSFFRCSIAGEPRPLEGQQIAWVRPSELGRYEFPPADAMLLERLGRNASSTSS
ncbi:MAG TPA: 8-oxo-dGTP diphosphatase MutT [Methylomirabilota bacterium]|nr:8-oxo-dGTP diphosphatase MutT [Methylomirabilota bacterium]